MSKSRSTAFLPTLAALIAATAPALAAPDADAGAGDLEALLATPVYAASKYKQTATEAPAAVTVLTQGDIRSFGWRTLGDVLNGARGVFIRNDRAYLYAGVRGLSRPGDYSSRLLLLIDGVRANDNVYDSVLVGREFPLDVGLIERVEFIPGAGSAMYGSNAVFGVINVVTRSAASLRGTSVTATVDTDRGRKLQFSSSHEFALGALLLAASAELRPGRDLYLPEFDAPETHFGIAQAMDGERDRKLMARFQGGEWAFSALASDRNKRVPNAPWDLVFNDRSAVWNDRMTLLGATWQRTLGDGEGWYAQLGVGEYRYRDLGRYLPDGLLSATGNLGRWWQAEARRTLRVGPSQQWIVGADVQRNVSQISSTQQLEPQPEPEEQVGTSGTRIGVFANDEIRLSPDLKLGLGARLDRESDGKVHATPRISLWWQAQPALVVKLLGGAAYREPSASERLPLYAGQPWNLGLRRERVQSRELVLDWRGGERLRLTGSVYGNQVADLIEQVIDAESGLLVYRNIGRASVRGVEAEAEYLASAGWRVRASWAGQRVRLNDGQTASNAPRSLFKLHATAPLPGWPVRLGLELQGMGQRLTLAGASLPTHVLANLTLLVDPPGRPWSLSASVYNLGNRRYRDPGGPEHVGDTIAQDGRSLQLRWTGTF